MSHKVIISKVTDYEYVGSNRMEVFFEGDCSDEYHSMHELYQHRMALTRALFYAWEIGKLEGVKLFPIVFRSKLHNDGTMFEGYFVVMATWEDGKQMSYHYKLKHWDEFSFLEEVERCPPYDGHDAKKTYDLLMERGTNDFTSN